MKQAKIRILKNKDGSQRIEIDYFDDSDIGDEHDEHHIDVAIKLGVENINRKEDDKDGIKIDGEEVKEENHIGVKQ